MIKPSRVALALSLAAAAATTLSPRINQAVTPFIANGLAGFEGIEEPTVVYFPGTNTFQNDPTNLTNIVDEGGTMFRTTLRNYYSTLGWWDGDRNTTNTDRQRGEVKGINGLGHQKVDQTFEYSFDVRTNPTFAATGHFCDVFQLKATDGNNGAPLATVALYKNGSAIQGRIDCDGDGTGNVTCRTFTFIPGQWTHVVIRITTCSSTESTGAVMASINGDAFSGITNKPVYLTSSTDYRPKFGLYRGIGTDYGVPAGDSWVEHRTVTGLQGSTNILTWKGGLNANAWDTAVTSNFTNSVTATASAFNTADQLLFNDTTANATVNLTGNVAPGYTIVNSTQNYTFAGTGSLTGGSLRKDGSGTLTLATSNSYPGLTDIRGGTLYVTGSIGNNSLVSLTGGTLRAGSASALGTSGTIGAQINGGTLDLNGFNLSTELVSVQGTGVSSAGAIVNTGAAQTTALTKITLTGDTTFGGTGRWDLRGTGAYLSTAGNAYTLTKTGPNQISFVGATLDAALGNILLNQGLLAFQTSTTSMGDPTKTLTIASGAILSFYGTTNILSKKVTLNGGTIWAESGTGTQNTFSGAIALNTPSTLNAGSALTGGTPNPAAILNLTGPITGNASLTKAGPGTVTLAHTANTWSGGTTVSAGELDLPNIPGSSLSLTGGKLKVTSTTPHAFTTLSTLSVLPATANQLDLGVTDLRVTNASANEANVARALTAPPAANTVNVSTNIYTTGVLSGSEYTALHGGPFHALTPSTTDLLLRYTYAGDATLDGMITADDYLQLQSAYLFNLPATWANGDFNHDGLLTAADFALIDHNFRSSGGNPAAAQTLESLHASWFGPDYWTTLQSLNTPSDTTPVPEPTTLALLTLGTLALLRRRTI